jgi:hypothetical protein
MAVGGGCSQLAEEFRHPVHRLWRRVIGLCVGFRVCPVEYEIRTVGTSTAPHERAARASVDTANTLARSAESGAPSAPSTSLNAEQLRIRPYIPHISQAISTEFIS